MIFLSKHISLYALGRLKWILDIVSPLNQHFNLKNQRKWGTTFLMLRFLIGIICILLHRPKKLTLLFCMQNILLRFLMNKSLNTCHLRSFGLICKCRKNFNPFATHYFTIIFSKTKRRSSRFVPHEKRTKATFSQQDILFRLHRSRRCPW